MNRVDPPKKAAENRVSPEKAEEKAEAGKSSIPRKRKGLEGVEKMWPAGKKLQAHNDLSLTDLCASDRKYRVHQFNRRHKTLLKKIRELQHDFGIESVVFGVVAPVQGARPMLATGTIQQMPVARELDMLIESERKRLVMYNRQLAGLTSTDASVSESSEEESDE